MAQWQQHDSAAGPARRTSAESVRGGEPLPVLSGANFQHARVQRDADGIALNRFIDPAVAIKRITKHTAGLVVAQIVVGVVMLIVAVMSDWRYGFAIWYTDTRAGGKLRDMQYAWAIFNLASAAWGAKVLVSWRERLERTRDHRLFHTRIYAFASYFTWAFGVWATAVLFASFAGYSFDGLYPTDLTVFFVVAAACALVSDAWGISKLCSISTYCARLQEEWRAAPHGDSKGIADPEAGAATAPAVRLPEERPYFHHGERRSSAAAAAAATADHERRASATRVRPPPDTNPPSTNSHSVQRRVSAGAAAADAAAQQQQHYWPPSRRDTSYAAGASAQHAGAVLLPRDFEALWLELPAQGSFETAFARWVPLEAAVNHLIDRGFQVVAAGGGGAGALPLKILFCAAGPPAESLKLGGGGRLVWFLGEFVASSAPLRLAATFKCQDAAALPEFVKRFNLQELYELV
ncbi:hypothetical protein JKP88DRAFT_243646 [Tribonema minus]|uniref:Beta-adaptin appendage C-terminal subdomain domain-containing protein n=1 Tax=Tribonema minus TaxID=303371 RepID=A0A835Z6J9_9STRA|nr:hypothetical protein JKP88DRAFT_243646 [Tribonema minus]